MRKLTGFELIHEEIIHKDNDLEELDSKCTVVAESKSIKGLLSFARLKKLNEDEHFIEAEFVERIHGLPVPDSELVGYLNDPKQIAKFRPNKVIE